jgi:hypothetical protein
MTREPLFSLSPFSLFSLTIASHRDCRHYLEHTGLDLQRWPPLRQEGCKKEKGSGIGSLFKYKDMSVDPGPALDFFPPKLC